MKKLFAISLLLYIIVFSVYAEDYATDRIIVKFKVQDEVPRLHSFNNTRSIEVITENTHIVKVPKGKNAKAMVRKFEKMEDVEFAEPDYMAYSELTPDDTHFALQWGLNHITNFDINAPEAWNITTGDSSVIIAILDTGMANLHEDLLGKVTDSVNFTHSPLPDSFGHGSHCAGIAAANTNNTKGIAGVSYDCELMNVKVLSDSGSGYYSWIVAGIYYAANNGAKVISMSFSGGNSSRAMEDAIDYAWDKGVVLVAAAGNNGQRIKRWPAASTNVMSIGAVGTDGERASFSNYSPVFVDVAAPGVTIYSIQASGGYMNASGTSMATPHVAGLAGLLFAASYGSNGAIRARIQDTCDGYAAGEWKHGRIDAFAAVNVGVPITLDSIAVTPANTTIPNTTTQQYTAVGTYSDTTTMDITDDVVWSSDTPAVATIVAGTGLATAVGAGSTTISATLGVAGTTTLTVSAATLDSIVVTPVNITLEIDTVQPYTATGTYSDASTSDITEEVLWASTDNTIASIDTDGVALTAGAGSVTISATLDGKTGSTTLSVTAASLVSITVVPDAVSIGVAATRQFAAWGRYSNNAYINISTIVVWASSSTSVATISVSGLATGVAGGSSVISARIGDVIGSAILTVLASAPTLDSISVTPASSSMPIGATRKYTAMAVYSDGSSVNITNDSTWASTNVGIATVGTTGLATAVSNGTTYITATYSGVISNYANLRVIIRDVSLAEAFVARRHQWYRGIAVTGYIELRADAALTNIYTDTETIEFDQFKSIGLLFDITTGSMNSVEYKILTSFDGYNWFQEGMEVVEPGVITDMAKFYSIPLYESAEYHTELVENRIDYKVIPFFGRYLKLQVKGTGTVVGGSCSIQAVGAY